MSLISGSGFIPYNLQQYVDESQLETKLNCFFDKKGKATEMLENLYLYLGKGDLQKGKLNFKKYQSEGRITVEKIGANKEGDSKFYLIVDKQLGVGGWNSCHIGVSQNATLRAVIRPLPGYSDSEDLENAEELRKALGPKYRGPISRVMNCENGIKVTELGGENLHVLSRTTRLTPKERLTIYKSLIQGLIDLHRYNYVHTDLKMANVVVMKNDEGAITGVKIIDLDRLAEKGKQHYTKPGTRYLPYSPERMFERDKGVADPKDDVWAAMLIICNLESQASPNLRFLNPSFISKYKEYKNKLEKTDKENNPIYTEKQLYTPMSLFDWTNPSTVFENAIFQMAAMFPPERPTLTQVLSFLEIVSNS